VSRSVAVRVAACAAVWFLTGLACLAQWSTPWVWGPILGAVGEDYTSMTWMTRRPVGFDLHYGLAKPYDATGKWEETLAFDRHEGVAEVWLRGLLPGSTYRYQLVFYEGDAVYPTEIGTFVTLRQDTSSFAFSVYGATRSFPDRHKLVADTIASNETAALVFHAGGLVDVPTEERFANFFWAAGDLARDRPMITVIGTRDAAGGLYFEYLALPAGGGLKEEQWWSFSCGAALFLGLDSTLTAPEDAAAMALQTAWLEATLAEAYGMRIVVFSHDALYSGSYADGRHPALGDAWGALFAAYGVDVVFSASPACYEHIYRDGVHYITTGGGGAPLAVPPDAVAPGTVSRRYGMLHYVRCTISADRLLVEAVPVASVVGDQVWLVPSGRPIDTLILISGETAGG